MDQREEILCHMIDLQHEVKLYYVSGMRDTQESPYGIKLNSGWYMCSCGKQWTKTDDPL